MKTLTLALVGSGGTGVVALGEMLQRVAARQGLYSMLRKTFGPQIRGGESAAILRLGADPVANFEGVIHALFVLDWRNFQRFSDEIPLSPSTVVIQDAKAGDAPDATLSGQTLLTLDFSGSAKALGSQHSNMALLGYLGAWLAAPQSEIHRAITTRLSKQPIEVQTLASAVSDRGAELYQASMLNVVPPCAYANTQDHWLTTGNQMAALGALEAGVRFVAAYPITPASDVLEWMASRLESLGGHLVQAEDELAAINMAIGAGFGGVPAFTATSGPGLALMSEAMGLAVASETPLVVMDVMRGGPSTGIPTKSEQADLNLALYGLHGDAPHLVISPLSISDCYHATAWAVQLASELQTLAIVLSDQFMGQSSQTIEPMPATSFQTHPLVAHPDGDSGYFRYLDTESGVSPMSLPGQPFGMYTADGLEHSESAVPSPKASDHQTQLDKRWRKLQSATDSDHWGWVEGSTDDACDLVLICWGSLYHIAAEARDRLQQKGYSVRLIGVRLLYPLPTQRLQQACHGAKNTLIVEQNHSGQFSHYCRSLGIEGLSFDAYYRAGPTLMTPQEIIHKAEGLMHAES